MLHIWRASGEELAAIRVGDFSDVRALKRHLQGLCGVPRFRQRLLASGSSLEDAAELQSSADLQLVLLPFFEAAPTEVDELIAAAGQGHVSEVEAVLQRPQDPDLARLPSFADPHEAKKIPLGEATWRGHLEIAGLLLEAGADKDQRFGRDEETCLHVACRQGNVAMVRLLLKAGADRDQNSGSLSPGCP